MEEGFFPNLFEQKYWKEITWTWYICYFSITHLIVVHLISASQKDMSKSHPQYPANVTSYGKRVFRYNQVKDLKKSSLWISQVSPEFNVFISKGEDIYRRGELRGKRVCEAGGRDWHYATISHGASQTAGRLQRLGW